MNFKHNFSQHQGLNSYFISFEGIEGSGKSTQVEKLKKSLEEEGYSVHILREPGGSLFGENLRKAILESKTPIAPLAESLLFASSRAQLLTEKVLPALKQEKTIVILDRYMDSSIAYQGVARGLGIQTVLDIHSHAPLSITPNLTFYLKIDLETSFQRQEKRNNEKDYFEKEDKNFYQKLIDGFNTSAQIFPSRIKTINAQKSQTEVQADINAYIKELLCQNK